jgi:hypothetical protein
MTNRSTKAQSLFPEEKIRHKDILQAWLHDNLLSLLIVGQNSQTDNTDVNHDILSSFRPNPVVMRLNGITIKKI